MLEDDWRPSVVGRNKGDGAEKATSISDREGVTDQDVRSIVQVTQWISKAQP